MGLFTYLAVFVVIQFSFAFLSVATEKEPEKRIHMFEPMRFALTMMFPQPFQLFIKAMAYRLSDTLTEQGPFWPDETLWTRDKLAGPLLKDQWLIFPAGTMQLLVTHEPAVHIQRTDQGMAFVHRSDDTIPVILKKTQGDYRAFHGGILELLDVSKDSFTLNALGLGSFAYRPGNILCFDGPFAVYSDEDGKIVTMSM